MTVNADANNGNQYIENEDDPKRFTESMLSEDGVNQLVGGHDDFHREGSTHSKRSI
jgi:hypothetical protein